MTRLVALVACLVVHAPSADAKCAMQHLSAEVLSDASNGAIVMTTSASYDDLGDDNTSAWRFKVDGKEVAPVIEVIAPGLAVYRLPKGTTAGELVNGATTLVKASVLSTKIALLPAPKVKAVQYSNTTYMGRKGSSRTSVAITGDIPADAVALVITDAKGTALSFGRVLAGQPLEPYFHGRCAVLPDGTREPKVGASVRLFWVDKYGRASAKSAAIRIVKAP